MTPQPALVFTNGLLATAFAKTCHGLLRGSDRFKVEAVIDVEHAGRDAGEVMDRKALGIPVHASLADFLATNATACPGVFVLGVAFPGGRLPTSARGEVEAAIRQGLSVVSGLHQLLSEDPVFAPLAAEHGVELVDIRKPRRVSELQFWNGSIFTVKVPRVAVLGMDCAVGKRTTCRLLLETCRRNGIATEMIYTGQTGWMQGYPHGLILDAVPNDFVSGELARAIVDCDRQRSPQLILLEGQSSLRNPSGPCGSELLLSAGAAAAIVQHAPGRTFFLDLEEHELVLPTVRQEIDLISAYGVSTLAVTLNGEGLDKTSLVAHQKALQEELMLPVIRPLEEGVEHLVPLFRQLIDESASRP